MSAKIYHFPNMRKVTTLCKQITELKSRSVDHDRFREICLLEQRVQEILGERAAAYIEAATAEAMWRDIAGKVDS